MKKIIIASLVLVSLSMSAQAVSAQSSSQPAAQVIAQTQTNPGRESVTNQQPNPGRESATGAFQNPIGVDSIAGLFYKVINFIVGLSYVVIAFFYLLAGFKFVKAQGNPEELKGAKQAFLNTTIGAIIIIGINVITQVIESTIQALQE